MILHSVMVTYNRLDCTKKALGSYLETVTVPYSLFVVDNGSQDKTIQWLLNLYEERMISGFMPLDENMYPGYATNRGWEIAETISPQATFLHRADNDWAYYPGWCDHLTEAFRNPKVGQVGLRTQKEEPVQWNVGGNCVIRRELWDAGLRYDERPWTELPAGHSEDTYLSPAVTALGYRWTRVRRPCIYGISVESTDDPYYQESYRARRIYGFK